MTESNNKSAGLAQFLGDMQESFPEKQIDAAFKVNADDVRRGGMAAKGVFDFTKVEQIAGVELKTNKSEFESSLCFKCKYLSYRDEIRSGCTKGFQSIAMHQCSQFEKKVEQFGSKADPGKHYRFTFKVNLTEQDIKNGFVTVKLDPYRVFEIYKITHPAQQHVAKKVLCAGNRGHNDTIQDIEDSINGLERWKEMLSEDERNK